MDRLLDDIRRLIHAHTGDKGALGDVARRLGDVIGDENNLDLAPRGSRHPDGKTGRDVPPDSSLNSATESDWGHDHDLEYHPGLGFTWSSHRAQDWEYSAAAKKLPEAKRSRFIPEQVVLGMVDEVRIRRGMEKSKARFLARELERAEEQHPGFDTVDQSKTCTGLHRVSDDGHIDRSRSTIHMGITSGKAWLNGSAVQHTRYIHIEVTGPDGRELVDINMTMEQFASFLVSQGQTPCTLSSYWSVNDENIRLRERVRPPQTAQDRLRKRIQHRVDEQVAHAKEVLAALSTGKPLSPTKQAQLAGDIRRVVDHITENAAFTLHQAEEEVAGIVESAAATLSLSYGIPLGEIRAHPMVSSLGSAGLLPAPEQPEDEKTSSR